MATNVNNDPYPRSGSDDDRSRWIERNTEPARTPDSAGWFAKVQAYVEQRLAATTQMIADVTGRETKTFINKCIAEHAVALPHSGTPGRFVAISAKSMRELKGGDSVLAAPGTAVCLNATQLADEVFTLVQARLDAEAKGATADSLEQRAVAAPRTIVRRSRTRRGSGSNTGAASDPRRPVSRLRRLIRPPLSRAATS